MAGKSLRSAEDSKTPSPELGKLGAVALAEAKKSKATYCDIRIVRLRATSASGCDYRRTARRAKSSACRT
jgi:hypothetical protein